MDTVIFALVMIAIVAGMLVMGVRSVKIQHEGRIGIVEAWGRFARVLPPGRFILWPWERVAHELPLQIFEWETPPQKLMLRGGAPLTLSAIIYYQIEHAHRAPGAPRPPRIMGSSPAPLGTAAYAPPPRALPAGRTGQSRSGLGIDSLEPGARTRGSRRGGEPAAARRSVPVTILSRVLGRPLEHDITSAAFLAQYRVHDWQEATRRETLAALQQVFSKISIAEDIQGDINWIETLGERVREHLHEKTSQWGVQIIEVALKDAAFAEMTLQNLNSEQRMEREGRVRTKEAESYKRVADILGLSPADLLRWRQVEIMRELSKSPQPRVMFTTDMLGRMDSPTSQQPLLPVVTERGETPAPQLPQGYLGSEPPTPPLMNGQQAARMTPSNGTDRGSGMIAPSIQNIDQQ